MKSAATRLSHRKMFTLRPQKTTPGVEFRLHRRLNCKITGVGAEYGTDPVRTETPVRKFKVVAGGFNHGAGG